MHVAYLKTGAGVLEVELEGEGERHEEQVQGMGDLSDAALLHHLRNLLQDLALWCRI